MWPRAKYGVVAVVLGLTPIETISAADFSYPETRREMVTETHHGVVVRDPYRWLESASSQEVAGWLDRQNAITKSYLDETPQWRAIAERLTVLTKEQSKEYDGLRHAGGRSFVLYKDPAVHQNPVLASLQEVDIATLHVAVDPRCVGTDCTAHSQSIDWFVPSPDGRKVAVSLSSDGSEAGNLHVFDVATRNEVDRPIGRVQVATGGGSLAWRKGIDSVAAAALKLAVAACDGDPWNWGRLSELLQKERRPCTSWFEPIKPACESRPFRRPSARSATSR